MLGGGLAMGAIAVSRTGYGKSATGNAVKIRTADGQYMGVGTALDTDALAFPGIRYARADRFKAPLPVLHAEQTADHTFGPTCPQRGGSYLPQSEDCLFLNVWTPTVGRAAARPVMVYFHGGAYSSGSVTDPINNGATLATNGDVVVVTVNHRLNVFGYLYLARLDPRFPDSGNAGQLDLIAALEWIRRNIADFGGDPGNITVFGQSGGGAKIATLMVMPEAAGLFHKAITMSGQQVTASGPLNATSRAAAFLAHLPAGSDPSRVPAKSLIDGLAITDPIIGGSLYMGPVLDMVHLTRHPFWPDAPAQSRNIPMLLGNVVFETRAFYAVDGRQLGGLTMDNLADRIAPEMRIDILPEWIVEQFRQRYPQADALQLFHRIVTAARSWRGQVEEAEARARDGMGNTYVYQLDFENAKHTDDIGLSFGTIPDPTPSQSEMSNRIMQAFVRFAQTGDPGWKAYDLTSRTTMVFDQASAPVNDPRRWERELFARVPYIQPGS